MEKLISSINDAIRLREYHKMACRSHAYELAEKILLRLMEVESGK